MSQRRVDVVVIGAGILGLAAAYHLAREGIDTLVVERGEPGRGASGAGSGGIQIQVRRRQLVGGAPARLGPMLALHAEAARTWSGLEAQLQADLEVSLAGGLMVAETPDQLRLLETKLELERKAGLHVDLLDARQVHDLCPSLSEKVLGADFCQEEGFGNSLRLVPALLTAGQRVGVQSLTRCEVRDLTRRRKGFALETACGRFEAARVVLAAGAWSGGLARRLGIHVPIGGHMLQGCVTEPAAPLIRHLVTHVARPVTLKQPGGVIIGGSWQGVHQGQFQEVQPESLRGNLAEAVATLPGLASLRLVRFWAGLNPASDGLPTIGACPGAPGLFFLQPEAGYSLGFVLARLLAELMTDRTPSIPIGDFSSARFV